jgi:hypothetical protein
MTVTTQSSPIMIHSEHEEQEWLKEYTRNSSRGKGYRLMKESDKVIYFLFAVFPIGVTQHTESS